MSLQLLRRDGVEVQDRLSGEAALSKALEPFLRLATLQVRELKLLRRLELLVGLHQLCGSVQLEPLLRKALAHLRAELLELVVRKARSDRNATYEFGVLLERVCVDSLALRRPLGHPQLHLRLDSVLACLQQGVNVRVAGEVVELEQQVELARDLRVELRQRAAPLHFESVP